MLTEAVPRKWIDLIIRDAQRLYLPLKNEMSYRRRLGCDRALLPRDALG